MSASQVRPVTSEDRAVAERTARALNEYYAARGKVINARACPKTGFVISDLSKPDALTEPEFPETPKPKSALVRVQEYFEAHPATWFRPLYLQGALKLPNGHLHVALSTLHSAGIVQKRQDAITGGRAIEYSLSSGDAS